MVIRLRDRVPAARAADVLAHQALHGRYGVLATLPLPSALRLVEEHLAQVLGFLGVDVAEARRYLEALPIVKVQDHVDPLSPLGVMRLILSLDEMTTCSLT